MKFYSNAEQDSDEQLGDHQEIEPLEGEVCPQFIRCGKTGCRCQYDRPHGPYYYRIWREGPRVHKVYVKASHVEAVRAACALHRTLARSLQDVKQAKTQLTQSMNKEWRRTQRLIDSQHN
jgi:hypothetical protein